MADIPPPNPSPVPTGAVQPPKKETGKVQPKKETVRINLPPKPTAAPTIKLPTLPPGGPTGAPAAAAPVNRIVSPPAKAVHGPAPPAQQRPAPIAQRPAAAAPAIKAVDKVLIFAAAVTSLVAVGGAGYIFWVLKNLVENFTS